MNIFDVIDKVFSLEEDPKKRNRLLIILSAVLSFGLGVGWSLGYFVSSSMPTIFNSLPPSASKVSEQAQDTSIEVLRHKFDPFKCENEIFAVACTSFVFLEHHFPEAEFYVQSATIFNKNGDSFPASELILRSSATINPDELGRFPLALIERVRTKIKLKFTMTDSSPEAAIEVKLWAVNQADQERTEQAGRLFHIL